MKEKQTLLHALAESPELRQEKERLEVMRGLLKDQKPGFRPFFSGRVINKISRLENAGWELEETFQLSWAFSRVALSGIALVIILLTLTYFSAGSLNLDAILGISDLSAENAAYLDLYIY